MAIAEVLKFESSANIFAWKHPNSELNCWTQLIVNESQEAVFVRNGQIADVFGPGKYKLSSDNLPILQSLINKPFGGKSPFSAEVWFINKAFSLDIKWGTTSPIQIQDPKYKVFVPVRAFGQFGIKIVDSKRFLTTLVGTMRFFNKDTLTDYFRGLYVTRVKDHISSCLVDSKISVLEINSHLTEISNVLCKEFDDVLSEFGVSVASFYVSDINVPETDPAVKQLKNALAKRAEMDIIGYSYQQERTFDTLETAADNQGAGTLMNAGIGLGMGFGIGGAVANQTKDFGNAMNTEETKICPQCNKSIPKKTTFCPECGCNTTKAPEATFKCASCGATINKDTKFCFECGSKINHCPSCGADMGNSDTCPSCQSKKCPSCGGVVKADAKFCPSCGTSIVKKCPGCGAEIKGASKFCAECGYNLSEKGAN